MLRKLTACMLLTASAGCSFLAPSTQSITVKPSHELAEVLVDGTARLVTSWWSTCCVWDQRTGEVLIELESGAEAIVAPGRLLLKSGELWDLERLRLLEGRLGVLEAAVGVATARQGVRNPGHVRLRGSRVAGLKRCARPAAGGVPPFGQRSFRGRPVCLSLP